MVDKTEVALFVMEQPVSFTWDVKVRIPLNGRYGEASFTGTFPNLTEAQIDELVASDDRGLPVHTNAQVAEKVLLRFSDLQMPDGSVVPFTEANLQALLAKPRVAAAVVGTFLAVSRGVAQEKNG